MRLANSYRGARRNEARDQGGLADWRVSDRFAIAANGRANIAERRKLCGEAVKAVAAVMAVARGASASQMAISTLRTFWRQHAWRGCGRAHSRILRDLGPEPKAA